jgi:nucleoside-diphosphate-sugar epimerase
MKILITGSTGFIGSHLLNDLMLKKHKILCISRAESFANKKIQNIKVDLSHIDSYVDYISAFAPEIIFHLAWEGIPDFSLENCSINIVNSIKFLSIISQIKSVKKIVITGTCLEYEKTDGQCIENETTNPDEWLAYSKKYIYNYANKIFIENKKDLFWIRLFYVYGPRQRNNSLIPYIIRNLKKNKSPIIKNLNAANDFIYISDVINGFNSIISGNVKSGIYNFGTGRLTSVAYILSQLKNLINSNNFSQVHLNQLDGNNKINKGFYANIDKGKNELNWCPEITVEFGLKKILDYDNE